MSMLIENFNARLTLTAYLRHKHIAILLAVYVVCLKTISQVSETHAKQTIDIAEHEMYVV